MTIQSRSIAEYRQNIQFPIDLCLSKDEGSGFLRKIGPDEADKLIERGVVEATVSGNYQRFKLLRLTCEIGEAERITATPREILKPRMGFFCEASKTVVNQLIEGERRVFRCWIHKSLIGAY